MVFSETFTGKILIYLMHWKIIRTFTENIHYSENKHFLNYYLKHILQHFVKDLWKDSFSNILLDNEALLDSSTFVLIVNVFRESNFLINITLSTPGQIPNKSKYRVYDLFKTDDSHIEKIKNYIREKYSKVALNHLKNQIKKLHWKSLINQ